MAVHARLRPLEVTAKHSFEIEVGLSGTFLPGCDAWGGSRFERPTNPPESDSFEDIDIVSIGGLRLVRPAPAERGSHAYVWQTVDLLEGVDRKSAAYQRIVQNLLAFIGQEEAEIALGCEL